MKLLPFSLLCALCGTVHAESRTWTTSDETAKKFEGEFISAGVDSVAIKLADGKRIVLPLSKLSQADKEFVTKQPAAKPPAEKPKETAEKPKEPETRADEPAAEPKESATKPIDSEMGKALSGKTVTLEGKSLRNHDLFAAKSPEYYLVYWGASSSKPCRQLAPHLTELYDTKVTTATNVEVVYVSCDKDEAKMKEFMRNMKFKFPAITMEKAAQIKILNGMKPTSIPAYKLLDSTGKVIAEGDEAKQKAEELAAKSAKTGTGN